MPRAPLAGWGAPLATFIVSQAVWFLSLLGAGTGRHWLGAVALAGFLLLQLRLGASPGKDLRIALLAAACGAVLDTAWARAGLIAYAAPLPVPGFAPYWILLMWVNFGLTVDSCLRWLQPRPLLAALFGAACGPLAYAAGFALHAAERVAPPLPTYGALAVAWAVAVPALLAAAARLPPRPRAVM